MPPKNLERRLAILSKKSVICVSVIMTVALWLTFDQYNTYHEETYFRIEKSSQQEQSSDDLFTKEATRSSRTDLLPTSSIPLHLPFSTRSISSSKSTSITSSSFKTTSSTVSSSSVTSTTNSVKNVTDSTTTTTKSRTDVWFTKLVRLSDIKKSENNIFFVETSCGTDGNVTNSEIVVHLNPRHCCAVQSAALTNTNRSVYILHTCPLDAAIYQRSPVYVHQTLATPNVYIVHLVVSEIVKESPVEQLYTSNKLASSRYPVEHLSDVLRQVALWKFGGTYLDLDTINIRPLDDLKSNYAGWQDSSLVASGVLNYKYDGVGHDIVTECLNELNKAFDGQQWGNNGPQLVTRTLIRMCKFQTASQLANETCDSFTLYPPIVFYPIYYPNFGVFFNEADPQKIPDMFNGTYNIHFWNKMSSKSVIEVGKNQLYGVLADKYCPGVYHNCGKYF